MKDCSIASPLRIYVFGFTLQRELNERREKMHAEGACQIVILHAYCMQNLCPRM